MDTLLLNFDYSPVTLRPCLAKLGQAGTYRKAGFVVAAIGSIVTIATPSLAVDSDSWDWDSESRQEETIRPKGHVRTNPGIDYRTGRVRDDQSEPVARQPQQTEAQEEIVAENQAPDTTNNQVIDDWRATRQSPEERMREQNPGPDVDCNGKPYQESDFSQAQLDADGNITDEGWKQMGISRDGSGKSFCQSNPNDPSCKMDANGDAG